MNNSTLFTIAIPAFKSKFLGEAIESCLSQTYGNFEVVIVDDASPEDLKSVVDGYHDNRIRFYRNEKNCGAVDVVDNWNICLSYAKGDYIICMGDDDRLLPNCLEEFVSLAINNPDIDVFHGWTEVIDEESKIINILETRPKWESVLSLMWYRWNGRQQFIGDFLYRTSTLRNNGGFYKLPLAWGSDDITAYINSKEHGIINTQVPVFQYRQTKMTLSSISNGKVKLVSLEKEKKWTLSFLASHTPKTDFDNVYFMLLSNKINERFEKRKLDTITKDIKLCDNIFMRVIYWIKDINKLEMSYSRIFKAILKGVSQH